MRRTLLVSLVLLLAPGCSFWAVRGPTPGIEGGGNCPSSLAVPVIDSVLAAGMLGLGAVAMAEQKPTCHSYDFVCLDMSGVSHEAGVVLLGLAALETAAAVYGGVKAGQCQRAKAEAEWQLRPVRPAPALDLRQAVR